jgi:nucleoside-diphosphate-sugar epimerase
MDNQRQFLVVGSQGMADETITIIGCGYTGSRLAKMCRESQQDVHAIVRSEAARKALEAEGFRTSLVDLDSSFEPLLLSGGFHVYMVPPPSSGDTDPRILRWLDSLDSPPKGIVYLSTTAVYGDRGGATVSEDTEPAPSSDRGRRRLAAETSVRQYAARHGVYARILRVPGIYGPDRLPLARISERQPIPKPGDTGPGNRIHVDDLAAVCLAAIRYRGALEVFNVGDGEHASMGDYFLRVARIAGLENPPQLPLDELLRNVSPAMRSFLTESRRVDVSRMEHELGFVPRYRDLDEGIAASLGERRAAN